MKNNINFWKTTYDILWILLISLLADFISGLKINFNYPVDCEKVLKFCCLIFSIFSYGLFYYYFKKDFENAKIEYDKNWQDHITNGVDRESLQSFFKGERNKHNFFYKRFLFIPSGIFFVLYIIDFC